MAAETSVTKQANPSAATLTDLLLVPQNAQYWVGEVSVANRSASPTSFRLSHAVNGAVDAVTQYVAYDVPIKGNDVYLSRRLTLAPGDVVRVRATLATLTFVFNGLSIPAVEEETA